MPAPALANGDIEASSIVGTLMEEQGDKEGAAAAYLRGADAGDAEAAFNLGRLRYDVGDSDGARTAFQRAHELGHEGAEQILDVWDREGPEPGEGLRPNIKELVATIGAMVTELATQRSNLRRSWIGPACRLGRARHEPARSPPLRHLWRSSSSRSAATSYQAARHRSPASRAGYTVTPPGRWRGQPLPAERAV